MAKPSRPIIYLTLGAVVVAAWVLTSEDSSTAAKSKATRAPSRTTRVVVDPFAGERDLPPFPPAVQSTRNAFKPLVVRESTSLSVAATRDPSLIPSEWAMGDPNWVYTGMAEVDGVPMALLENKQTMESVFVKQGERWMRTTISQFSPGRIILTGPGGQQRTIPIYDPATSNPMGGATGVQPVRPELRGPIGGGLALQPEQTDADGRGTRGRRGANANNVAPTNDWSGVTDED